MEDERVAAVLPIGLFRLPDFRGKGMYFLARSSNDFWAADLKGDERMKNLQQRAIYYLTLQSKDCKRG